MSGFISTYLADKLLDHVLGNIPYTPPGTLYVALFTVMPIADGTGGTEPAVGSYARKSVANDTSHFATAAALSKTTNATITFITPTADWGTIVGAGWYDDPTAGNLLAAGPFPVPRLIASGVPFFFGSGGATVNLISGNLSYYLGDALLDHVFGATTFTAPAQVFTPLFTAMPTNDGVTAGTEVSGGSYARAQVTTNLVLTQVAVTGGNAVYSYSSVTGTAPWIGQSIAITGFATGGNNVTATVTAVSAGVSFTVATTTQVNETHAGAGVATNFPAAASASIANSRAAIFPAPAADWGTVIGSGYYDASSSGNMLWVANLDSSRFIANGAPAPDIAASGGQVQIF